MRQSVRHSNKLASAQAMPAEYVAVPDGRKLNATSTQATLRAVGLDAHYACGHAAKKYQGAVGC